MGQSKAQSQSTERRATRSSGLRRPPEKGLPRLRHNARRTWRRLLEMRAAWILLFLVVATWSMLPRRAYLVSPVEAGSIAGRTYVADRDLSIPNEAATRALQERAATEVRPIYDFDRALAANLRRQLATLFETGRAEPPEVEPDAAPDAEPPLDAETLARWSEASGLKITAEQAEALRARGFSAEVEDRLAGILLRVLRQGVVSDKALLLEHRARGITVQELPSGQRKTQLDLFRYLDYPEDLQQAVEQYLLSWDALSSRERGLFAELIMANVAPNLTYNSSATLALERQAAAEVGTVSHTIRSGEVIVRRGERIDELAARAVRELAGARNFAKLALSALGTFFLLAAAVLLIWLVTGHEKRRDRSRIRLLNECLILLLLHFVGARFAGIVAAALANAFQREPWSSVMSYTFAVPLASLALLSVLLYGRNVALVLSLTFSLLVGHVASGEAVWMISVYALAGSLAAVYAIDHQQFKQRSAVTKAGAMIGLVNMATLLGLKAMSGSVDGGAAQLGFDLVCGFAGGLLAAAVTSFSVPILEGLLSLTTSIKLIELANPNLPILRKLALQAPGSFQHSLAVANLAKSGCEAIDCDSVLANTGALYHDIGKCFRPQYFIENQMPGRNPHDKIQPSMSALILINHVKEGLELAYKNNLPQPILDAIGQHHGTRLIKFFYNRAKERCDPGTEAVREEEFRYPGPKPQSKEMGVLMLADAVEAASRTLAAPSRQKLKGLVRTLFDDCLSDGQLDQTDLTLGDLRKVEDAFLRVLTNIYHRRIDYPGFDFNAAPGQPPPEIGGDASGVMPRPAKRRKKRTEEVPTRPPEAGGERRKAS